MIPAYFYLVEIETNRPLATFPVQFGYEGDVITFEAQLRAEHNVDDPASRLALRDSLLDPLAGDTP